MGQQEPVKPWDLPPLFDKDGYPTRPVPPVCTCGHSPSGLSLGLWRRLGQTLWRQQCQRCGAVRRVNY